MAVSTYGLVRTLHLIAASLVFGGLVVAPFLRPRIEESPPDVARAGLATLGAIEQGILAPSAVLLLIMGLLMVEGPAARYSFTAPGAGWLHLGSTLWLVLVVGLGVMWYHRDKLQKKAREGVTGGNEVAKLWRRWTLGASLCTITALAGIVVMAMKIGA